MPCSYLSEGGSTYNKATIFLEEIVNKGEIFFAAPLQILNHYERNIFFSKVIFSLLTSFNDDEKNEMPISSIINNYLSLL